MSKEIYISSTPHETRLAIVENDALTEIYYERENEYTLAGSIYNGKVTRVLPGMQSSFVDIGLERDAFLYITDFMEEAPDSAEFETASIGEGSTRVPRLEARTEASQGETQDTQPRMERGERNERNGRGDRGRGRGRGERPSHGERVSAAEQPVELPSSEFQAPRVSVPATIGIEASADQDYESPADSGEVGEGAPGADGSRRWRGRRGRRRGRGPVGNTGARDESPQTTSAGSEHTDFAVETENEPMDKVVEAGESYVEPAAAPAPPPPVMTAPQQDAEQPYGRRNEGGRNDGARGDRGRDRDRGRNDRGGRGDRDGRPARVPRGFAPSTSLYGVDSGPLDEGGTEAPVEPIILPGESLSKYRKGSESEVAPVAAAPAPSTEFTLAQAWDGGSVLPGESLSRHRRSETRGEPRAEHRVSTPLALTRPAPQSAPEPVYAAAVVQEEDGPSVAVTPETQPEVAFAAHPELVPEAETIHEESTASDSLAQATPEPATEYEPHEGFASYKVDPIAPSEYRQAAPVDENVEAGLAQGPSEAEVLKSLEEQPGTSEFGNTHFLTPAPIGPEPILLDEQKTTIEAGTEDLGRLVGDVYVFEPTVEPVTGTPLPGHDVTTLNPMGEMVSMPPAPEPELAPAPLDQPQPSAPIHHETAVLTPGESIEEFEEDDDASTQTFAPGQGDLEEELIEEEEYEVAALHAGYDDEMDDLEEETLEGAADLGTMLREMSIDQITRTAPEAGEDEDLEEDNLEEDDEERRPAFEREEQLDEDSEEYARTAESAGDFSNEFREPESSEASAGPLGSYTERRGGRRDVRRGGRDRDPRRGGDSSSRPRNMGGSGDADRGRSSGRSNGGRMGRGSMQSTNLPAISELLKPGQEILVQIAKEPIAKKGARITSHIALPGRFLVFMPTVNHTGVSRKIESDGERRRLKEILLSEKGEAAGGFIVRTAASGASEEELRSDLRFLLNLWTDIKNRSESSKSPALIYHDLNLVERVLRDQVTDNFSAIWVDTETEYERVLRFLQRFQPSLIRRVKLYLKETPLFEQFGITEEINKALRSKVWLKSGGSIVINQTEALVAIDINTGKFVGKTARLEDTIVKTNLDAIPEIVRQIRLRDLGGIIIIDFIDMDERKNRNKVMAALEEELKSDRAPSKVLQFNDFGLVAITRKRVKQSLERTLSTTCNVCVGTGMVKSPVTVCNDIYIEMRKMYKHLDKGDVMLRVHPEVVKQLKSTGTRWLQEMEEMSGKTILVKSDPSLHPEQFDIH